MLFGFIDRIRTTDEGFSAIYAHGSVSSGGFTVFRLHGTSMTTLIDFEVESASNPMPPHSTSRTIQIENTRCTISGTVDADERAALLAAGLDPARAAEHFCRQDWVGRTYVH